MPNDSPVGLKKAKRFLQKQALKNSVKPGRKGLPKGTSYAGGKGRKQAAMHHKKGKGEGPTGGY